MDMHAAALPPRSGSYTKHDEAHPLFPLYRQHLSSCARLMIDASDFQDWIYQHNRQVEDEAAARHPRFAEFQAWCREVKAGARKCCPTKDNPGGLCFPHNFRYWLDGGRW
jgi:hypothetical protein